MSKKYGKTSEEEKAEKSIQCRQIVLEINRFGVSESQRIQIIKLLALELENNLNMKKIINTIDEIVENNSIHDEENKLIGL
jgi:hypothetical protein|tara:strand:- start:241 stop:483 length:243 start_codon:yes stop_codon:yes gene_type:complete